MSDPSTTRALILAGGLGQRLRPLTDQTPKCLVEIGGRPLLDYWFELLAAAGVEDVLINTHHLVEPVREYIAAINARGKFRVEEAHEPELLGSAGTLTANRDWMDGADECLVIYADNFSNANLRELLAFHRSHDDPFSMLLFHTPFPKACGIAALDDENRIVEFVEKPESPASDLANGGIYVVDADLYRAIADQQAFDLGFDVIPNLVGRMRGWVLDGYHRDIGTLDALERARADAPRVFPTAARRSETIPPLELDDDLRPAVFLDRDGTIIEHVHHLADPKDVRLISGAAAAIRKLSDRGYVCVVVTNQSVIGRGIITEERLHEIHDAVEEQLRVEGAAVDAWYFCPTAPRTTDRSVIEDPDRKPGPGMLQRSADELGLDLSQSWMIGDMLSDTRAGRNAGCKASILLRTGLGESVDDSDDSIDHVASDLVEAVDTILSVDRPNGATAPSRTPLAKPNTK